ncbi:NADP-dependent malic enzyme [Caulobacter sp. NIBR2454]|uniref:NADP-dependent malic enzyme n=1 Tax=Caulobacter sp. NIBR2454 TaxID=3015996 RepID=UPI0022B5FE7B|nr:NADP-dependent malic enzyme [Caulobacter sp. NIBR2454]
MKDDFRKAALDYHRLPRPGKLRVEPTKRMATQHDLALAYSPGVAAACEAIVADPDSARDYTARGNLVAVISNGTAVLGLGNIGPLAGKPVMEGKAVLFQKFAGIDVFDLEVDALDPDLFVEVVAALEPTFGGINLEDIKAPECFEIERRLRERMKIPVFHDDQHGTAIVCAAAVRNALVLQGKDLKSIKLVTSGAGAAALACVDLLVAMGLPAENVTLTDIDGVVYEGRQANMPPNMARYARKTDARTLGEVITGADVFLGLSAPRVFKPEWLPLLADKPLILAMANPDPEILPELVNAARPDAIMATGRSDYPNQVNNVLCFPFIFRGALDVGATEINEAMKAAAVEAIASLARVEASEVVAGAYGSAPVFGPDYIIPKPFDPRLILEVAPAVARAAMDSGVATRAIKDFDAYRNELEQFVYRSGQLMRPVFERARKSPARVAYAEGEDERVLRAVQTVVDEGLAKPVLIGRRAVIEATAKTLGLRFRIGVDIEVMDPSADSDVFDPLVADYQELIARKGVPPLAAARRVATRPTVAAAMLLKAGLVDAALVGGAGDWWKHVTYALPIVPAREGVDRVSALSAIILNSGTLFLTDTHVNVDPTAEQIAESTLLSAEAVRRFGLTPKAALLSHSSFGASNSPTARKMRQALGLIRERAPDLEVDGEMHADAALSEALRGRFVTSSPLSGSANLLIMPSLDAANIALTLLSAATESQIVGPLMLGLSKPLHALVPSVTARGVVNMTALVTAQVQDQAKA